MRVCGNDSVDSLVVVRPTLAYVHLKSEGHIQALLKEPFQVDPYLQSTVPVKMKEKKGTASTGTSPKWQSPHTQVIDMN